jgi:autotransporter-associated beta strand protein
MVKIYGKSQIFAKAFFVPIPITSVPQLPTTIIWTGLGSSDIWSISSNWNTRPPQAYESFQFAGTTRLTPFNNLTIDTPFNGITFNSGSGAFTLNGNRFVLNSGSISNSSINIQTINNDIVLGSNAGTINCATSSIFLNGKISGSGNLTKLGASTLSLSGNNTYTGNTYISAGIIDILNSNPFGTGTVYLSGQSGALIRIPTTSTPINTIINNSINLNGQKVEGGGSIRVDKSTTINGLLTLGPENLTNNIYIDNNATLTFNGGISAFPTMGRLFRILGNSGSVKTGTLVLSSNPIIFDNPTSSGIYADRASVNVVVAVSGNKFTAIRLGTTLRTDVPLAINNDLVTLGFPRLGSLLLPGIVDLNGNDQIFNRLSITTGTPFSNVLGNNIFNNSSTFANLSLNNTGGSSTYTGSISGNINLTKIGSQTLTLSGSTALGIGPRYTGFTAISAGTLINYALSSNPSNKVNFAQFSRTALTVNFTTPPIVGDSFILLPARTINSYPSVSLVNASSRSGAYNSSTSTLSITS